jgi:hypothetical protein
MVCDECEKKQRHIDELTVRQAEIMDAIVKFMLSLRKHMTTFAQKAQLDIVIRQFREKVDEQMRSDG